MDHGGSWFRLETPPETEEWSQPRLHEIHNCRAQSHRNEDPTRWGPPVMLDGL